MGPVSNWAVSVTTSVMLIICGALVNGPYALITTAVSADLVSEATAQEPGITGGMVRASVPTALSLSLGLQRQDPQSPSELPSTPLSSQLRAPTPPSPRSAPLLTWCWALPLDLGPPLCSLSPGDSQEPEGQRKGTVHRHGHYRWHRVHRSVTGFWLLAAEPHAGHTPGSAAVMWAGVQAP